MNSPREISGCNLWLHAGAGVTVGAINDVQQWLDQSGNANNFAPSDADHRPLLVRGRLNDLPVIHFNSTSTPNNLKATFARTLPQTLFVVGKFTSTTNGRNLVDGGGLSSSDRTQSIDSNDGKSVRVDGDRVSGPLDIEQWHVYAIVFAEGAEGQMYVDGLGHCTISPRGAATTMSLGARGDDGQVCNCEIAEVISYDGDLTTAIAEVCNYLNAKYNVY